MLTIVHDRIRREKEPINMIKNKFKYVFYAQERHETKNLTFCIN